MFLLIIFRINSCSPAEQQQRGSDAAGSDNVSANSLGMYKNSDMGNFAKRFLSIGDRKTLLLNGWTL